MAKLNWWSALGPGLMYAGAAVGVSHLVQSTRAGASFGLVMIVLALFTNFVKYPFFEYGPRYTAATGKNLLEGYAQLGKWAIGLFLILTVGTVFTVQAAVTIVTAGLFNVLTGWSLTGIQGSALLLLICMTIIWAGRFQTVNSMMKYIILVLSIATLAAVIIALSGFNTSTHAHASFELPDFAKPASIAFLVAFIGWMPAPFDVAVLHSIWSQSKNRAEQKRASLRASLFDFHVGYWGTMVLAICFVTLGSLLLFNSGIELSSSGADFARQLIDLYAQTLGSWTRPVILVAAFATMFSTTLAILDGFSRVFNTLGELVYQKPFEAAYYNRALRLGNLVLAIGALVVLAFLSSSMRSMVDFATTLSFITAPLLAFLNYRVIYSPQIPIEYKPKRWEQRFAQFGLVVLFLFTLFFLYFRLFMV